MVFLYNNIDSTVLSVYNYESREYLLQLTGSPSSTQTRLSLLQNRDYGINFNIG